ncbi:MAG: hypothetical protein AAGA93_23180 [Actinomycetota bacterium]
MADGPSEPPLPPAYQAVHAALHRVVEAQRQLRWRRSVDAIIAAEEQRLRELWLRLRHERADVEALESLTLRSMRSRLQRSHRVDVAAERADVRAIEDEIAMRLDAIDAVGASPGRPTLAQAMEAVDQAKTDLDDALAWWRAEHVAAGTALGLRLLDLDRLVAYLEALRREVNEAIDVTRLAIAALMTAGDLFPSRMTTRRSARPDTPRIDAIANVQRWLVELRAELADLHELQPPLVDGPEIVLPSPNIGPDDIVEDWIVGNRLVATTMAVEASLVRVQRVADQLRDLAAWLDDEIEASQRKGRRLLVEHPGVV